MQAYISKLPNEIIQNIIGYTITPQSLNLRNDIQSYILSLRRITYLYNQYWTVYMHEEEEEYKNWIVNDIIHYMNQYQGTMYGYVEKFYNIFLRNTRLNTQADVNKYYKQLEKMNVERQINSLWGLLTPSERDDLIRIFPDAPNMNIEI